MSLQPHQTTMQLFLMQEVIIMANNRIPNRRNDDYDEFHETMNPAVSTDYQQQSRVDTNTDHTSSMGEQIVRTVASVLSALLLLRLLTHLFSNNQTNGFVGLVNGLTDWMATPFQGLFQNVPAGTSGFFDIPAIAALISVMVLAYLINRLLGSMRGNNAA